MTSGSPPSCSRRAGSALLSRVARSGSWSCPSPRIVALRGGWPTRSASAPASWPLPGPYTLVAEKAGYRRLEGGCRGDRGRRARRAGRHTLLPLPGRLTVDTGGVAGVEVAIDGAGVRGQDAARRVRCGGG